MLSNHVVTKYDSFQFDFSDIFWEGAHRDSSLDPPPAFSWALLFVLTSWAWYSTSKDMESVYVTSKLEDLGYTEEAISD